METKKDRHMLIDTKVVIEVTNDGIETNEVDISFEIDKKFVDVFTAVSMAKENLMIMFKDYIEENDFNLTEEETEGIFRDIPIKHLIKDKTE